MSTFSVLSVVSVCPFLYEHQYFVQIRVIRVQNQPENPQIISIFPPQKIHFTIFSPFYFVLSFFSPIFAAYTKLIMTQLNDKDRQAQMDDMRSFDEQMPCVGIFWYDPDEHNLFGVRKQELTPKQVEEAAEKGMPFINYPHLHRQVWAKEYFRAQAKHEPTKFKGDYTQIPRGRVTWNIDKFIVLVGHWAEPIEEELTALLEQEFSLPYFEYVYDEHWDLGHGWSGDMP